MGEEGELWLRGPQVMQGYWQQPDETAKTITEDGWLRTGDIARMDEDGYFYIVDRLKDIIIASGFNIVPREVEEVLFQHPKVQEAVVAGVPDAYRGETVKAYVVLKPGQTATAEEIIGVLRGTAGALQGAQAGRVPLRAAEDAGRQVPAPRAGGGREEEARIVGWRKAGEAVESEQAAARPLGDCLPVASFSAQILSLAPSFPPGYNADNQRSWSLRLATVNPSELAARATTRSRLLPYFALIGGVLCISFTAIFTKWAAMPGPVAAAWRMTVAILVLAVPFAREARRWTDHERAGVKWGMLGGLWFALNLGMLNSALLLTSAANATLLDNTAPIWVGLGALVLFKEKLGPRYWIGLTLALLGAAVVTGFNLSAGFSLQAGDALAFFGAIFYAGYLLTTQRARRNLGALSYVWIMGATAAASLFARQPGHGSAAHRLPAPVLPVHRRGRRSLASRRLAAHRLLAGPLARLGSRDRSARSAGRDRVAGRTLARRSAFCPPGRGRRPRIVRHLPLP